MQQKSMLVFTTSFVLILTEPAAGTLHMVDDDPPLVHIVIGSRSHEIDVLKDAIPCRNLIVLSNVELAEIMEYRKSHIQLMLIAPDPLIAELEDISEKMVLQTVDMPLVVKQDMCTSQCSKKQPMPMAKPPPASNLQGGGFLFDKNVKYEMIRLPSHGKCLVVLTTIQSFL